MSRQHRLSFRVLATNLIAVLFLVGCGATGSPTDGGDSIGSDGGSTPSEAAEQWPTEPITIIVPTDPGGGIDRLARGIAVFLGPELGVPIVVENRPGGALVVGNNHFLQQPADGQTLLITSMVPHTGRSIIEGAADYEIADFSIINAQSPEVLLLGVGAESPWATLDELITHIESNPGDVVFAGSQGSMGTIALLSLLDALGLPPDSVRIISYDSGSASDAAIVGGTAQLFITGKDDTEAIREHVRPLAIYATESDPDWDAPPVNEALSSRNIEVPITRGTIAALVAHPSFKEDYPDRYEKLVEAYERGLQDPVNQEALAAADLGAVWLGPDASTEMVVEGFEVLRTYIEQAEQ